MTPSASATPSAIGVASLAAYVWPARAVVRRVAILGASKNAGKTTALLALATAACARDGTVGLVSIGVDGEDRDAWLDFAKPRIVVERGAWVVSARAWIDAVGGAFGIVRDLGFGTALGPTSIAVARARCNIQLGGIGSRAQLRTAVHALSAQARLVLIDGAYHRQAAAHPEVADAVVVAVGALAGPTLDAAIAASMPTLRALLAPTAGLADPQPVALVEGALTDAVIAGHPGAATLVARDPSRILLSAAGWQGLDRRGALVVVQRAVPLAAVVVNPFRPDGHGEDAQGFGAAVAAAIARHPVPILDVVAGLGWLGGQELALQAHQPTIHSAVAAAARDVDA